MFVLTTFDTLYQGKLALKTAPTAMRNFFKISNILYVLIIIGCCIIAITKKQIFWVQLYGIFILIYPSTMAIIVAFGLINVIRKMNDIRRSIEITLKAKQQNIENATNDSLKDDANSSDPQKHS